MAIESFKYDNKIVKYFMYATIVWGITAFTVGLTIAIQMYWPALNLNIPWLRQFQQRGVLMTNGIELPLERKSMFHSWNSAADLIRN